MGEASMSFRSVAITSAILCFALTLAIGGFSPLLLDTWGLSSALSSEVVARRAAMLFLGLGTTLWMARNEPPSPTRTAVSVGFAITCFSLAILGVAELAAAHVGLGILLPAAVEIAIGTALVLTRNR